MPSGIYVRPLIIHRQPHSEETKRKISLAHKGKPMTDEHKIALSIAQKNRFSNPKERERIRKRALSLWANEQYRDRELTRRASIEGREKIRINHPDFRGALHPKFGTHLSEETKRKIGDGNRGKIKPQAVIEASRIYNQTHPSNFKGKRHSDESKIIMSQKQKARFSNPENHPMWHGGISFFPYPITFNKRFKRIILARDNNTCQLCLKTKNENGVNMTIHHINYNKSHTIPSNCISLCRKCHGKVNSNSKFWEAFLNSLIIAKGGLTSGGKLISSPS